MTSPRVDVGVVSWNTRELTISSLRRLLASDSGCDLRVLVCDNASTDGSAEAIAEQVPEAELEVAGGNLGFAAGMNRLLARSSAPWFLALNSDAWPEVGAVRRLVDAGAAVPTAAAVAPRLERPDGMLEHSTHRFPSVALAAAAAVGPRIVGRRAARRLLLHGAWLHDAACEVDWAVGAGLLMRRRTVEEVGGFDERYFMYVEDLDWCWRARQRGWTVRFEPSAVVRHVGNASGALAYGDERAAVYLRNTYRFYREARGPLSTAAFRLFSAAGAARLAMLGRLRSDDDMTRHWLAQFQAHLRG